MFARVARPGVLEPFLLEHHQRLVQTVERVHRRGVVIHARAFAAPVRHDEVQIEKPALHGRVALADRLHRARTHRHRRNPGWTRQTFLRAGIHRVGTPCIDFERNAPERGHRIDDRQAVVLSGNPAQRLRVGSRAGRGFGVHERDDFRVLVLRERLIELVWIDRRSPRILHQHRFAADPTHVFLHAPAEHAVHADDHLVARLDQVHEARFHSG
jgi:hypothetical protein